VWLAGCGHGDAEKNASVTELNRQVQSLRSQNNAYQKQVEELENRVFIMNDQPRQQEGQRRARGGRAEPGAAEGAAPPASAWPPSSRSRRRLG
jgi:hypothetical protein